jgi:hypothetical protein
MPKYLLAVTFEPGVEDKPMTEWTSAEIDAHLSHLGAVTNEMIERGELVSGEILAGPDLTKIVTADKPTAPVVTDGPFTEFKEWLAGYQIIDTTEERAIEIAAQLSAAPGPGGVPVQQPIHIRPIMSRGPSGADEMREWYGG